MTRIFHSILFFILPLTVTGCAVLPVVDNKPPSHAVKQSAATDLTEELLGGRSGESGESAFHLLANGQDAFVARVQLAQAAEKSIDAQYYLYHDDLVGKLFTLLLVRAADRGVRVRLLVDDMALGHTDTGAAVLDSHPNIEVRIFNPFGRNTYRLPQYVTRFGTVTRRMHNKSFTVDNVVSVVGGRNIGDEYFGADDALDFGDLEVLTVGPLVKDVSSSFDLYWNNQLAYPAKSLIKTKDVLRRLNDLRIHLESFADEQSDSRYMNALRESNFAKSFEDGTIEFEWGDGRVLYDNPDKIVSSRSKSEYKLTTELNAYSENVKNELIIFSPYFVPGKKGVDRLVGLVDRGVRVAVLTNSLASTDVAAVHAGYSRYRKKLLRGGVELYEFNKQGTDKMNRKWMGTGTMSKASLHVKSFIYDRERVFIGSLNLDPRSIIENTEIGLVIEAPETASKMAEWFDHELINRAFTLNLKTADNGTTRIQWRSPGEGEAIVWDREPHSGLLLRTGVHLLRLLPIDSQL